MASQRVPLPSRRPVRKSASPRSSLDLVMLGVVSLVIFVGALYWQPLNALVGLYGDERIGLWTEGAIVLAPFLALGLAIFSIRRWQELRQVLKLQDASEDELRALGEADQRRADQMSALNHMGQTVLAKLEPHQVLEQVIAEVGNLFQGAAGISLLLREKDELVFAAVSGSANTGLLGVRYPITLGISGQVAQTGRSMRVTDHASQAQLYRGLEPVNGFHTQSLIAVPLKVNDETLGVLVAVSPEVDAFDDEDLHLLEGAGHWALIAIEHARRYEAEESERTFAQTLVQISNTLNDSLEPDVVLDRIMESVASVASYDQVTMRMVNEPLLKSVWVRHQNAPGATYPEPAPEPSPETMPLWKRAAEQRETICVPDTQTSAEWVNGSGSEWVRSCLLVPIDSHGILLGVLSLKSATAGTYTASDAGHLKSFAGLVAVTLERALLYDTLLQRSQRLALVNQVGALAVATLDLHTLLQSVADLLRRARRYPNLGILLAEGNALVLHAVSGEMQDLPPIGYRQAADVGVMGHAFQTGSSYRVAEMQEDPHYYAPAPQLSARSELAVPIYFGSSPLGIINIESQRPNAFDNEDVLVVQTIADQLAGAIHNAQLYQETETRAEELRLLYETTRDLMSEQALGPSLALMVERMGQLLGTPNGYLFTFDEPRQELELIVGRGTPGPVGSRIRVGVGVVGAVARDRRTLYLEDYQTWEHGLPDPGPKRVHAVLAVPLIFRGTLIGVLGVHELNPVKKYSERQIHLLELFAGQIASLVQTVRLLQETQAHLAEVMVLHGASQDLNKTLDLDATARTVAVYFQRALELDTCTLLLLDGDRENYVTLYDSDPLSATNSVKGSVYPVSMLPYFEAVAVEPRVLMYQQDDPAVPEALRVEMKRLRWNSLMVVPLIHRGISIGLVELGVRSGTYEFSPEQVRLAVSLANHAAVAVENARLYQETRIQAEHLEVALETEYKMRHQLVQADKLSALGRMVASIAHEVNNPLQSLQNCLYILSLPGTTPDKHKHYVTVALSEIDRLANLIVQLRSVYRPSLAHASQTEPLGQLIGHVTSLVTPHLERHRVALETAEMPPELAEHPVPESLRQVLINLALNAVDAMAPEGGTLALRFGLRADEFDVFVQDSGRGIAPEALPHLFEPFYSTKEMGMGLGLAICYDIVYRNGGRIEVESAPDRGTCFAIHLPRTAPPEPARAG